MDALGFSKHSNSEAVEKGTPAYSPKIICIKATGMAGFTYIQQHAENCPETPKIMAWMGVTTCIYQKHLQFWPLLCYFVMVM